MMLMARDLTGSKSSSFQAPSVLSDLNACAERGMTGEQAMAAHLNWREIDLEEEWDKLAPEEKEVYSKLAQEDMERYEGRSCCLQKVL